MAKRQADLDRGVERMLALNGTTNDVTFTVTRGVTRPVWEPNAGTMALYERARAVGKTIGLDLIHGSSGGALSTSRLRAAAFMVAQIARSAW